MHTFARRPRRYQRESSPPGLPRSISGISGLGGGKESEDFKGATGLNLLYEPQNVQVDLIFVHGLGGGSRKTWSRSESVDSYWPQMWLPEEPGFENVRIHSFGYNADWSSTKDTISNITDFANMLVAAVCFSPKFHEGPPTPIIFAVHSMGGLVTKKMYLICRQYPKHEDIGLRTKAMVFFAVPHRGSGAAAALNNVLRYSFSHSARHYVADLERNSGAVQAINDEFRHYSDDMQFVSFYETIKTSAVLGVGSALIVDKSSAILGYKREVAIALNANHREVCKFDNRDDPNYITVRDVLATIVRDISGQDAEEGPPAMSEKEQLKIIRSYVDIQEPPEEDLETHLNAQLPGIDSCQWLTSQPFFETWRGSKTALPYVWLHGKPGSGKSVLAAHVISTLKGEGHYVSYFFFKGNRKSDSKLASFLRSMALQMAVVDPVVRAKIVEIYEDGSTFGSHDYRAIWLKLFAKGIFLTNFQDIHFWVVDAVDECSDIQNLFPLLARLDRGMPFRFFFTSRLTRDLEKGFSRLPVVSREVQTEDTLHDMEAYIESKLSETGLGEERQALIVKKILEKASGCFLWVRLILQELESVHTTDELEATIAEVPQDMDDLYIRILDHMSSTLRARDKHMAQAILTWTMCATRPMTITELSQALSLDHELGSSSEFVNLKNSIMSTCGQMVFVDAFERVQPIHQTAREFLFYVDERDSEFAIIRSKGNERLAQACLTCLSSSELNPPRNWKQMSQVRKRSETSNVAAFIEYSLQSFSEHLQQCSSSEHSVSSLIGKFLSKNVVTWIERVAENGKLDTLIRVARNLLSYHNRRAKHVPPLDRNLQMLEAWSIDLVRIAARFGRNLLDSPMSIYWLIPAFCPSQSAAKTQFLESGRSGSGPQVLCLLSSSWDNRLSCINFGSDEATALASRDGLFAVARSDTGKITLFDMTTCQELRDLNRHGDRVERLEFNANEQWLASCSKTSCQLWETATGQQVCRVPIVGPVLSMAFQVSIEHLLKANHDSSESLLIATGSHRLLQLRIPDGVITCDESWQGYTKNEKLKMNQPPTLVAINANAEGIMIAVVHRGRFLALWDVSGEAFLGFCRRPLTHGAGSISEAMVPIYAICINPVTGEVAASYQDGDLAVYEPWTQDLKATQEDTNAHTMVCSPDGRTIVTGDSFGTLRIWNWATLDPMYVISAYADPIISLAFGGDNLRFLDIQGCICNVWEPSVLVRPTEAEEDQSDAFSLTVVDEPAETTADKNVLATVLAAHHDNEHIFCGKDNGTVAIHVVSTGLVVQERLYRHAKDIAVKLLQWNESRGVIASADVSNRVLVQQVLAPGAAVTTKGKPTKRWTCKKPARLDRHLTDDGPIHQLILSSDGQYLLISTETAEHIYNLDSGEEIATRNAENTHNYWFQHPCEAALLIEFVAINKAHIFKWSSPDFCAISAELLLGPVAVPEPLLAGAMIRNIFVDRSFQQIILEYLPAINLEVSPIHSKRHRTSIYNRNTPKIQIWPISTFSPPLISSSSLHDDANVHLSNPSHSPYLFPSTIQHVLGLMDPSILVFLDHNLWICTFDTSSISPASVQLRPPPTPFTLKRSGTVTFTPPRVSYKRHFFIPYDWGYTTGQLVSLLVNPKVGDLVIGHGGWVGCVRNGFEYEEVVDG